MKVALSTKNNMVTEHFGHCDYFIVYDIKDKKVRASSLIKNPPHQKGLLPKFLKDNGVDVVIAGGIGQMAVGLLKDLGIECYMNIEGEADQVIQRYLNNEFVDKGKPCEENHH